jgi:hypothetical protein
MELSFIRNMLGKKTLNSGLVAASILLANITVLMGVMVVSAQQPSSSSDFKFKYIKSGGIKGQMKGLHLNPRLHTTLKLT